MKITGTIFKDSDTPLWAMAASFIALISAFGFQYLGGMAPCELCLWQRIPHGAVVMIGIGALLWFHSKRERLFLTWSAAIMFAIGASIALYHVGVEQQLVIGPGSCAGDSGLNSAQSIEQLRKMLMAAPIVRCSEIPWSFFGLSIAAFNAITSMVLAILCGVSGMRQLKVESL